jgi:glycosyltransferase involved in cell wall biosynthesis
MEPRLRVLRISHTAALSAYRDRERALSSQCELELALVCPEKWPHLGGIESVPQAESFPYRTARTFLTGSVPLFAFDPLPLIELMRKFQPDIVDIHEEPYSVSCIESLALAQRYAPQAACVFYSAQNIRKKYPPPFCWTEQYVYSQAKAAYPCSSSVRDVLIAKGFRHPCPVIPLGVNPHDFSPQTEPLALPINRAKEFVIGYTGRIETYKGIEHLLRAVSLLSNDTQVRVIIAGTGSNEGEFRALSCELGIAEQVLWIGEISASKMAGFYRNCNVVVVPSITTKTWREQFGRVPVEAMACGVPVVVTDSGSLPEVVGDDGIIVPEKDPVMLADAVRRLLNDTAYTDALIKRGVERVSRLYTWSRVAEMTMHMYRGAVAAKRKTKPELIASQ